MSVSDEREVVYSAAKSALDKLESAALSSYVPSFPRTELLAKVDPNVTVPFIDTELGQKNSEEIRKLNNSFRDIEDFVEDSTNEVSAYTKPPTLTELEEDPLGGWQGLEPLILWTDLTEALRARWLGPISEDARDTLSLIFTDPDLPNIEPPALARSQRCFTDLRAKVRGGGASRSVRTMYAESLKELDRRQGYHSITIARYCLFLLEYYTRDYELKAIEVGMTFDQIQRKFSAKYGDIYAQLTDALISKGKTETSWFWEDYKTRLELWKDARKGNADNYLSVVEAAYKNILAKAKADIETALANFDNNLKILKAEFDFKVLDSNHEMVLNADDLALYTMQVGGLQQAAINKLNNVANEFVSDISVLSSFAESYSNMFNAVASRYIELYSKQNG